MIAVASYVLGTLNIHPMEKYACFSSLQEALIYKFVQLMLALYLIES